MKKIHFYLGLIIFLGSLDTLGQNVSAGLKGGVNFSNTTFVSSGVSISASGMTSFHLGGYLTVQLAEKACLQFELLYSKQGFNLLGLEQNFSYLQIPVLFRYTVAPMIHFHLGPQYGILLTADGRYGSSSGNNIDQWHSGELSLVLGGGFDLQSGFNGGIRYVIGLTNNAKDNSSSSSGTINAKNEVWQIYIGIRMFKK